MLTIRNTLVLLICGFTLTAHSRQTTEAVLVQTTSSTVAVEHSIHHEDTGLVSRQVNCILPGQEIGRQQFLCQRAKNDAKVSISNTTVEDLPLGTQCSTECSSGYRPKSGDHTINCVLRLSSLQQPSTDRNTVSKKVKQWDQPPLTCEANTVLRKRSTRNSGTPVRRPNAKYFGRSGARPALDTAPEGRPVRPARNPAGRPTAVSRKKPGNGPVVNYSRPTGNKHRSKSSKRPSVRPRQLNPAAGASIKRLDTRYSRQPVRTLSGHRYTDQELMDPGMAALVKQHENKDHELQLGAEVLKEEQEGLEEQESDFEEAAEGEEKELDVEADKLKNAKYELEDEFEEELEEEEKEFKDEGRHRGAGMRRYGHRAKPSEELPSQEDYDDLNEEVPQNVEETMQTTTQLSAEHGSGGFLEPMPEKAQEGVKEVFEGMESIVISIPQTFWVMIWVSIAILFIGVAVALGYIYYRKRRKYTVVNTEREVLLPAHSSAIAADVSSGRVASGDIEDFGGGEEDLEDVENGGYDEEVAEEEFVEDDDENNNNSLRRYRNRRQAKQAARIVALKSVRCSKERTTPSSTSRRYSSYGNPQHRHSHPGRSCIAGGANLANVKYAPSHGYYVNSDVCHTNPTALELSCCQCLNTSQNCQCVMRCHNKVSKSHRKGHTRTGDERHGSKQVPRAHRYATEDSSSSYV